MLVYECFVMQMLYGCGTEQRANQMEKPDMSPSTLICKQNRGRQTPITTMPPLQIRTTHLFNCTNINTQLKVTDLWTAPVEMGKCTSTLLQNKQSSSES